jgi:hypothetical protein
LIAKQMWKPGAVVISSVPNVSIRSSLQHHYSARAAWEDGSALSASTEIPTTTPISPNMLFARLI